MQRALLVAWSCCFVLACGGEHAKRGERHERDRQANAAATAQVVSTVNGHAILLSDVAALREGTDLTPEQALRKLQTEQLLIEEAVQRGVERDPEVQEVARKAAVQALLQSETDQVKPTPEELEAQYVAQRARFELPERRSSVHLLARVPKNASASVEDAAKAIAQRAIAELSAATDLPAYVLSHKKLKQNGIEVLAEQLPPFGPNGRLERPYLDAIFALKEPGVVPEPVRTSYGWHAVRMIEIVPPHTTPHDEAIETLRGELVAQGKVERVARLIAELRKRSPPVIPENATSAISDLKL